MSFTEEPKPGRCFVASDAVTGGMCWLLFGPYPVLLEPMEGNGMTRRQDPQEVIAGLRSAQSDLERRHGVELDSHARTREQRDDAERRNAALVDLVRWLLSEHPLGELQVTLHLTDAVDLERVALLTSLHVGDSMVEGL